MHEKYLKRETHDIDGLSATPRVTVAYGLPIHAASRAEPLFARRVQVRRVVLTIVKRNVLIVRRLTRCRYLWLLVVIYGCTFNTVNRYIKDFNDLLREFTMFTHLDQKTRSDLTPYLHTVTNFFQVFPTVLVCLAGIRE